MATVVVTGGSAGIGLATAARFAREGWQVMIVAREPTRLAEARDRLSVHGPRIIAVPADVADAAAVEEAAARAERELGGIDAWINNAMATVVAPADQVTPEEYARVTAVTYLSQVHGTLAALRRMRAAGRGAIVQVSSGLAIRPAALQAAYCGAKAAVTGFTDALRTELIAEGSPVTLSTVYLPGVDTPQPGWARNRTGHAQVIPDPLYDPALPAEAIYAAVRDPQREIWVGRSTMMMALGQLVSPSLADRAAASMMRKQQGEPAPIKAGNLDTPVSGPARTNGEGGARTIRGSRAYLTTRQRDLLHFGAAGALAAVSATAGFGLSRRLRGR